MATKSKIPSELSVIGVDIGKKVGRLALVPTFEKLPPRIMAWTWKPVECSFCEPNIVQTRLQATNKAGNLCETLPGKVRKTTTTTPKRWPRLHCVTTSGTGDAFNRGHDFAAWIGLAPRQHSTGGMPILGRLSKRGSKFHRTLFIQAARTLLVQPHN